MLIDQWLYLPQPGYGGAWCWTPVALRDRVTGRVFSLLVGLSNEDAARRWASARRGASGDDGTIRDTMARH